ncbi:MAG: sodium-dependent transporter [Marinilabiliales bacterium]|nr:MAG: sodium-dependent transporter [Marinilabiliales bacterium]
MAGIGSSGRDGFTSKFGIIAAAAGSAVGLGNIWRFPYVAGDNGGGAFLLFYLLFIVVIGVPVMLSEFTIGRRAQANPFGAFMKLKRGKPFVLVGIMGIVAAFFILAFYSTVAGWTLEYVYLSVSDAFNGKSGGEISEMFNGFYTSTWGPLSWQLIFMILTAFIVFAGVQKGIEKYTKILMPMLLVIILVLCVSSVSLGENVDPETGKVIGSSWDGLKFLFYPDFSKINAEAILAALGQAFFSLSIGMGVLITYGSYIGKDNNLTSTAVQVSFADTLVAVLAGVAIFPAVYHFGMSPEAGPGLVFKVLPNIFQAMPGGYIFAILFFLLLTIAALTSSISVLEVVVASMVEELKMKRVPATVIAASAITVFGVLCTMAFGELSSFKIFGKNLFDLFEFTASNIFLPLGGLLIVIYLGWFMGKKEVLAEISNEGTIKARLFGVILFIVRFIAPVAIAFVFLNGLGVFGFEATGG